MEQAPADPPQPQPAAPKTYPSRGSRPPIPAGLGIDHYSPYQLKQLMQWLGSDGLLRPDDDLIRLAMAELGLKRKTEKVTIKLQAAIRAARKESPPYSSS